MIALALAVPVAAVAIAFGGVAQRGTSTSTTMALTSPTSTAPASVDGQWNRDLEVALSPLSGALTRLAAGVDRWSNGDLDDDGLSGRTAVSFSVIADSDCDGMSDDFETRYGLEPLSYADAAIDQIAGDRREENRGRAAGGDRARQRPIRRQSRARPAIGLVVVVHPVGIAAFDQRPCIIG